MPLPGIPSIMGAGIRHAGGSSLLTGLVAAWKLADLTDSSGNGFVLNNTGSATFNTGKIGNAVYLVHTSSQFLSTTALATSFVGDFDWTISYWIYATTLVDGYIMIGADSDTQGRSMFVSDASSAMQFNIFVSGSPVHVEDAPNGGWVTGAWNSIIIWHDSVNNQMGIQVDARTAVTGATGGSMDTCTGAFDIGARAFAGFQGYWDGRIDDCNVWSRVLTSGERTTLYNGGAGLEYPF